MHVFENIPVAFHQGEFLCRGLRIAGKQEGIRKYRKKPLPQSPLENQEPK
jgi:hypothetical protein